MILIRVNIDTNFVPSSNDYFDSEYNVSSLTSECDLKGMKSIDTRSATV